ncbi:MAG TPA: YraN family protein [Actinomycetes bacterium]|jgi:putative endonuclease|nr:YraN family protein [Actinomycetes bacterium]
MSSDARDSHPGAPTSRRAGPDRRGELGRQGEQLACDRLAESGLRVVDRNWRCRIGEIDVIAAGPGLLVFCEVKTRRGDAHGSAAAAVTPTKQARLRRLAAAYLSSVDHQRCKVRFDVVAVTWPRGSAPTVDHLERAF